MTRRIGTVSRGLRGPIVKEGDDLRKIVVDTFMACLDGGDFEIGNKDVLAITESILARAQKNYATTDQLATDVRNKLGGETVGVVSRSSAETDSQSACVASPKDVKRLC